MLGKKTLMLFGYIILFVSFSFADSKNKKELPSDNGVLIARPTYGTTNVKIEISKILDDKYLVSALYYSDSFFAKIRESKTELNTQSRIVLDLSSFITNDFRNKYIEGLMSLIPQGKSVGKEILVSPLDRYRVGTGKIFHDDAIDLFTLEGRSVKSMSYGIVVLAENGWLRAEPDKTVSNNGGNEIIIFSPSTKSFYRYCHLGKVLVETGDIVNAGKAIGTVGHSGLVASQYGHGEHLHLEINQYKKDSVVYLSQKEILKLLRGIKKK